MIKGKVISAVIFSTILFLVFLLGSLYAGGVMGDAVVNGSLTVEGKLGAGLVSIGLMVWFWSLAVVLPTFTKWRGKSGLLTAIFVGTLFLMPFTMVAGIVYVSTKQHSTEKVTVVNKNKEGEAA